MNEPTPRQIRALSFLVLLPPATRLLPGAAARAAGRAMWLCPLAAAPLCALLAAAVSYALRSKRDGEGLGEVLLRAWPRAGRALLLVYGLWLALYAGFAVRSAASRFIYTIYSGASPWLFVAVGLALGLAAALGGVKRLARTAEIFRVLLLAALAPILALGLFQADWGELLPVTARDAPGVALGALETLGTAAFALVNVPLLETGPPVSARDRGRSMALWSCGFSLLLAALTAAVLGRFGPDISAALTYPFFALVRGTGLFGGAVRIEALVTGLWVLSDFALCALSLKAGARCICLALGLLQSGEAAAKRPRALATLACAALAAGCALAVAPDSRALRFVSDTLVVYANIALVFALMLPALALGMARRRI